MIRLRNISSYQSVIRPLISNNRDVVMIDTVAPEPLKSFVTPRYPLTAHALSERVRAAGAFKGLGHRIGCPQWQLNIVRFVHSGAGGGASDAYPTHNDFRAPDWTYYRRDAFLDPTVKTGEQHTFRKISVSAVSFGGAVLGLLFARNFVYTFANYLGPSEKTWDSAKLEVNIGGIPEGKTITVKWMGKPVFIKHRTAKDIKIAREVPLNVLRDPQTDEERTQRPEWLIVLAVCTHLGCVPLPDSGDFRGYFCPCHGSHYDGSGRVRRGPAPLNLEVPPVEFISDDAIIIGD